MVKLHICQNGRVTVQQDGRAEGSSVAGLQDSKVLSKVSKVGLEQNGRVARSQLSRLSG